MVVVMMMMMSDGVDADEGVDVNCTCILTGERAVTLVIHNVYSG